MRRAVFLDRDGVVNRKAPEGDYVKTRAELELLPGVGGAVRRLNLSGWFVVLVTNQRGVARGMMTAQDLDEIHRDLAESLEKDGAHIDFISSCVHDTTDGCDCRKPRPGMLLTAAREHDLDLDTSWMVGDRPSDIAAGRTAGCRTILVGPLAHDPVARENAGADRAVTDLAAAVEVILEATA